MIARLAQNGLVHVLFSVGARHRGAAKVWRQVVVVPDQAGLRSVYVVAVRRKRPAIRRAE